MIKARGTSAEGREVVVLGLSYGNLDNLRNGKPILFDGTPYGFAGDVMIVSGETEHKIAESLGLHDPKVKVNLE